MQRAMVVASLSLINIFSFQKNPITLRYSYCSLTHLPIRKLQFSTNPRKFTRSFSISYTEPQISLNSNCINDELEPYLSCSMPGKSLKVAILLSGGVDSSVALRLLHHAGHSCTAFYLKIWFQVIFIYLLKMSTKKLFGLCFWYLQ